MHIHTIPKHIIPYIGELLTIRYSMELTPYGFMIFGTAWLCGVRYWLCGFPDDYDDSRTTAPLAETKVIVPHKKILWRTPSL